MDELPPLALMAGAVLPPGVVLCLRRCGWTAPAGVDVAEAAGAHTAATSHPTLFRRPAPQDTYLGTTDQEARR